MTMNTENKNSETVIGKPVSLRKLTKLSAAWLKRIRETYKCASLGSLPSTGSNVAREWLCDNYYLIEREGRAAISGMKNSRPVPAGKDGIPYVFSLACELCDGTRKIELSDAEAYLAQMQYRYTLSNAELFSFRDMICAATLKRISDECAEIASQSGGSAEVMASCVGTLRAISGADFSEVFERISATEKILLSDPAGLYRDMSEETKEYYRSCISSGAMRENIGETEFVKAALEKAEAASSMPERHIGAHIVPKHSDRAGRAFVALYYAMPFVIAACLYSLTRSIAASLLSVVPLWGLFRAVCENIFSSFLKPKFVCSLNPKRISADVRTTVVISCLITSPEQIKRLIRNLRQVRLSGRGVRCGLLADLKESRTVTKPEDKHLISVLEKEIRKLNTECSGGFFAIVRKRSFASNEGKYMGRERKRGAITDFIKYMRTGVSDFLSLTGDLKGVVGSRYLLTLDADTTMSIDAVAELTAVLEHPLNKAVVVDNSVVSGYGIAVPRLTTDIESSSRSFFSRAFAGAGGLHSYGGAGGDFFRDLFGNGLFTGKGIIDVEAFAAVADGAFPEGRILSHDIIEGGVLKACTASSTELSDSFPTTVKSWLTRHARWIRGDFQNLFFLFRNRKNESGETVRNSFAYDERYKLFENIRRAISPLFIFISLIAFVFIGFRFKVPLMLLMLASVSPSDTVATVRGIFKPRLALRRYISRGIPAFLAGCARIMLNVIMLPQLAVVTLTELVKVSWRGLVSHKHLLEWITAAEAENGKKNGVIDYCLAFKANLLSGLGFILTGSLPFAILGAIWILAPFVLCEVSRPSASGVFAPSEEDEEFLYSFASSIWRFFEKYVTEETNFLPPDNVQYSPYRVAMRTSPTNIGLYLLCALSARDFGFIESAELCEKTTATLKTLEKLDKWNGNLYNWYDIKTLAPLKPEYVSTVDSGNLLCCLTALKEGISEYAWECPELKNAAELCEKLIAQADISRLYNERRKLFYIGYDAASGAYGTNYYDILMSEARMTSYYAIAKKVADKRHWGMLGRLYAGADGYVGPLSWTGTMFEYFMPHMLLPTVDDSLTDEALRYALYCQKKRTKKRKLPWGISESGFYSFDLNHNYQYKAFGVQKLGLKSGLDEELVISPYSTFLALPFAPDDAVANLKKLVGMGMNGEFGLYEAVDFTAPRTGGGFAIVKSYMAHHMGMSLVSLANCIFGNVMQKRFMRDRDMRTAQKLLEEAVYESVPIYKGVNSSDVKYRAKRQAEEGAVYSDFDPSAPRALVLSNGEFSTVITDGGSGFSTWNGLDMSVHRRDLAASPGGVYVMLRDAHGEAFSLTSDPIRGGAVRKAEFSSASAVFTAVKDGLEAAMGVGVHGKIPAEIRMIKLGNTDKKRKDADLLIYTEPVMRKHRDHIAHPAFSDLFIVCEYREAEKCLLMWRRGDEDEEACIAYGFVDPAVEFGFETDRSKVLKKGRGIFSLDEAFDAELSGTVGTPVIPCALFKTHFSLKSGDVKKLMFIQCAGRNREEALSRFMIIRRRGAQSAFKSSWDASENMAAVMDCTHEANKLMSVILPRVLFNAPRSPASAKAAASNKLGRRELWSMSVSGDNPIVVCCAAPDDTERAAAHISAHRISAIKGIDYDLCIIYREGGAYDGAIRASLSALIERSGRSDGVFLIDAEKVGEDKTTLLMAACVYCDTGAAPLAEEFVKRDAVALSPVNASVDTENIASFVPGGGFEADSFVSFPQKSTSPLPWCFPMANKCFGTLVSDSSLGFSFHLNSQLNQLTPWSNDYMSDNIGEKLYAECGGKYYDIIRGSFVRFGRGFAEYRCEADGIIFSTTVSVHKKLPVKTVKVTVANSSDEARNVSVGFYADVLPAHSSAQTLKTEIRGGILFADNPYNDDYPDMCAALSADDAHYITGRETYFSGDWTADARADERQCAAAVVTLSVGAGEKRETAFHLSMARGRRAAEYPHLIMRGEPTEYLVRACGSSPAFTVRTPSESIDKLVNFYLPYQAEVSRVLSRTGFSQNSGGYGFRDQLQDVCALAAVNPETARLHILKAASVQFVEGDVLHWWHNLPKESGGLRGVRTRCSDDLLWLPYSVARYVEVAGDSAILDDEVRFIKGEILRTSEAERYTVPEVCGSGSVYRHCVLALKRAMRFGAHGLLLIGSGDWNDGMNRVGIRGSGESVWLSMFAVCVAEDFAPLADSRGDALFASELRKTAERLRAAVEACFEGDRYLRGYHDDGSPIGSEKSDECRLDSLPQSFSAFCGCDKARAEKAVSTAAEKLVIKEKNIVKLFDPPFHLTEKDVGYIKRYPKGIRENGGQYTHAAVWLALAALRLGMNDKGFELLEMISPITHCFDSAYKTEPYFIAADIYTASSCPGRGGWTVYTGAASWYYRTVIEDLLGIKKHGNRVTVEPRVPSAWNGFEVDAVLDGTRITLKAERTGAPAMRVNGIKRSEIILDGSDKEVFVEY